LALSDSPGVILIKQIRGVNTGVILKKQIRGVNTWVILIKQIRGEHSGDSDKTNQNPAFLYKV
jgi:hypothetical protein